MYQMSCTQGSGKSGWHYISYSIVGSIAIYCKMGNMNHFLNGSGKAQIDDFRQSILWKTQAPLFPLLLEDGHVQCSPTAYEGETLCLNEFGRKTRRKLENRKFCTKVNKKSKNNRKENPRGPSPDLKCIW